MLRSLTWSITALCVVVCTVGPIVWFVIDEFVQPYKYIHRNPDGSSTGYYLESNSTFELRNRGYSDGRGDAFYQPWKYIPLFAIVPILWFYSHRTQASANRQHLLFIRFCALSPLSAAVFVAWFRRDDVLPVLAIIAAGIILVTAVLVRRMHKLRAERQITKGLCLNCGYDLRATPNAGGPLLSRCPECGSDNNIVHLAAARERAG